MVPFRVVARMPVSQLIWQFVQIYLLGATVLTLAIVISIHLDQQDRLDRISVREAARVEIARSLVEKDFSVVSSDLRLLAETTAMHRYLDGTGRTEDMAKLFLALAKTKGHYDQVRFLAAAGQEVVRINYNAGHPYIVPREQLQDKSKRYFFRDAIKLDRDEVFISPLDLNIEHDQLEVPYKPMIRFGMPVFDSTGRKRGIVLLNYLGEELLQHFRSAMQGGDLRNGMLLNRVDTG